MSFEPLELNAGFILMGEDNGYYESEEKFYDAYIALLGVKPEDALSIVQTTRSQKLFVADKEVELLPSSGDFIHDALSTPKGDIYIGGQLLKPVGGSVAMEGENLNPFDQNPDITVLANTTMNFSFNGLVGNSGYNGVYYDWFTKIFDFKINGISTSRFCTRKGQDVSCYTWVAIADKMDIRNRYQSPSGGITNERKVRNNVDSMSLNKSDYVWLGFDVDIYILCGRAIVTSHRVTQSGKAGYSNNPWANINCP